MFAYHFKNIIMFFIRGSFIYSPNHRQMMELTISKNGNFISVQFYGSSISPVKSLVVN